MNQHPSLEYLLVACVAAAVTFLLTPIARQIAIRWKAVARPRDRDVHAVATPRMGGLALFAGLALGLFVASRLPSLHRSFENGPDMPWVLISAAVICAVGLIDDRYELDSVTKLAGQVLACGLMVTKGGVQLAFVSLPGSGTFSLGRDLGIPVTILLTVLTINAMNFIDGLDGLAAGVTLIAAGAFFLFSYHLAQRGFTDVTAAPTLLAAALAGACAGFLPHNFWPARVFMGDSGSMVLGLMLSAAATSATTSADPLAFQGALGSLALYLPLLVPLSVLALPFVDLLLAVVRRVRKGRSPFAPDKQHLHHRLLELGHSHRRAVLLLYFWSAVVAFSGVGLSFKGGHWYVIWSLIGLVLVGMLVSVVPTLTRFRGRSGS
ncbi:MAG: UDP-GlcNAc:undecaprenyl-phosphate/decaprenyl-phosphate GlcNAc-phosphate transferase [Pseudonocardiales bacterium]|jgi:UDP-GlcNAc:undecaprenyl-phosphate GlcNAc-1-phosphate transferase|nr:UDP-GlcNAc:undecaprenyl-phosphate/decaprenyl-phosphate GlcNAc-phosphate transferase [Pseudonocardiales bacterium]MDT4920612.1 UDP-GlcNAc:undecaprenyl-phosphate/decaprenyl-phosphate GlcNAc-phosphate transferase [Pseudonocardiales bacterium]MDT4940782.1 UDP-GlcNAc:undecaprenyl-phosphate/decaprenyl-phosphate GlcNAc-phosphate transferase [Pseudonocardiales bacterium]